LAATGLCADTVDNTIFNDLLKKHVNNGAVDYAGLKTNEAMIDRYLKVLEDVTPDKLSRNEQLAFYINAYNAWTIKLVLSGYPGIKSIKDLATWPNTPWKKEICRINSKVMTLDHIEHNILRPRFKDPRIHFAVNCASKGCPPLGPEAYQGGIIDKQLDDAVKSFINDPKQNYLKGKKLYVSKIFKWFPDDFNNDIAGFVLKYAKNDLKNRLMSKQNRVKVSFLDYDWTLNSIE
jgi:hypothetical protein